MKSRLAYPLLFLLPAAMAACIAGCLAAAGGAGVLWLVVFGDDAWPEVTGPLLMGLAVLVAAGAFAMLLSAAYSVGREQEPRGVAGRHVALAVAITLLIPLFAIFQQWYVGNLGP